MFKLFLVFLFSFFFLTKSVIFQVTCNSGLCKPIFHPLICKREKEIERYVLSFISSYFKKQPLVCFLLFSVGKANHMFLTKCILHICEASVFPAGHLEGVGCCSPGSRTPGYTISNLWPSPVKCFICPDQLLSCAWWVLVVSALSVLLATS